MARHNLPAAVARHNLPGAEAADSRPGVRTQEAVPQNHPAVAVVVPQNHPAVAVVVPQNHPAVAVAVPQNHPAVAVAVAVVVVGIHPFGLAGRNPLAEAGAGWSSASYLSNEIGRGSLIAIPLVARHITQ